MRSKIGKRILSIVMTLCLIVIQSVNVNASNSNQISEEQLGNILKGMDSIVLQLESLGLNDSEINEIFQLSARESEFYSVTQVDTIPFDGNFVMGYPENNSDYDIVTYASYDGNPPETSEVQKQRIQNIYGVALRYFRSDYYEGNSVDGENFGNYLTYLYLSHYIDGPGRAPTANDLPYIISSSDISAYDQFLLSAKLSNWANALAGLGCALYSDIDYISSVNAINTVDQTISENINEITMIKLNGYNTADALNSILPLVKSYIVEHHTTASNDEELTQGTLDYVSSRLEALNFYKDFDENVTKTVISIVATTIISAICGSVSLMGLCVSVIPFFVYGGTGLIQSAILVKLQYSFSWRYAVRTGIYLEI